jgi:hypothetical protein
MVEYGGPARPEILVIPDVDAGNDEPAVCDLHASAIVHISARCFVEQPLRILGRKRKPLQLWTRNRGAVERVVNA